MLRSWRPTISWPVGGGRVRPVTSLNLSLLRGPDLQTTVPKSYQYRR
jgi:hypothetical protein